MNKFLLVVTLASMALTLGQAAKIVEQLREEYANLGSKAQFYDETFLNGLQVKIELEDGECRNMPKRWVNRAKSVDTHGTCVRACTEADCGGTCKYIYPGHGEQQLSTIKLDKVISSITPCF